MRKIFSTIALSIMVVIMSACNNSDMEKRVTNLERRVAGLENSGVTTTATEVQPVSTSTVASEAEAKGPFPEFSFEKEEHDFGTIKEGDVVNHIFKFTNTGEAPLVIQSATATCGCTVPSYPKEPIPVGGKGEIEVRFDSSNKSGAQNKTITITANTNPKINKVKIKTVVTPNS